MQLYDRFSCFIIGAGTLPIQCAEILLQRGHQVHRVISSDDSLHQWAKENGIPYHHPQNDDLLTLPSTRPFDYLFSIVNRHIIPTDVLTLPGKYPINYHDAPLPRYAGVYATSWAIMHRERTHGITWHVMTEQVDAGDILKQRPVAIAPDDTALTLNAKCYQAAICAFTELVDDLARDQVTRVPQNLADRTRFSLYQRPDAGCVLSWQQHAEEIDALVRALTFGSYPNRLGLPKLAIGRDFVIVSQIDVLESKSDPFPGTITHIDNDTLVVTTASNDIAIQELLTIDGRPLPINDFVGQYSLRAGYQLVDLDPEIAGRLTTSNAEICKHESFWVKRLTALQPIELPYIDYAISPDASRKPVALPLSIPDTVAAFIASRGYKTGNFLLSAFVAYLVRLTNVTCFDVGFRPLALPRDLAGLESFFAPCVPLRVHIDAAQHMVKVHRAIQTQIDLSIEHQSYARDITARYPELGQLPVFPVKVAQVESLANYQPQSNSKLTFVIPQNGTEYQWVYHPQALDGDNANRMMKQFITFLRGVASQPERPIWQLPLLTEAEQRQLLLEWNDTKVDYPRHACLHELFEAQVEQTPDAIAVVFEEQQLTYQELNEQANQLAHYLRAMGVGPEILVGVCMERSLKMLVGIFGILKAGGAYVPLDPTYPRERLAYILGDAQSPVLLTQERLLATLPAHKAHVICLDTEWKTIAQENTKNLICQAMADNLAYVIYTSGSTGKPKGTMIPHQGLVNYLNWCIKAYTVAQGQGAPLHSSIGFDLTVTSLFAPLLVGQRVVILPEGRGGETLNAALRRESGFSFIKITPAHLKMLNRQLPAEQAARRTNRLIIGGEALRGEHLSFWQTCAPSTKLVNEYGPTETVVGCCVYNIPAQAPILGPVPIGRPIANIQLYILNQSIQPVPIGISGELHIGGHGVARGYLNRPQLTAEKFIPNPFSDEPGARLYKTGDLARYLPDSNIEFLGRIDHQVKIRGFRIELGEIEAVLCQHPSVQKAIVTAREDVPGDKRLVAYFVAAPEHAPTPGNLRDFLKKRLPGYMTPSAFAKLETIPLTPNGKVDRRALPAPSASWKELKEDFVAPRTRIEKNMADIWARILQVGKVGIYDNFFELGGHSLLAIRVISQLREAFRIDLPLHSLFESPTVANLSERIAIIRWAAQDFQASSGTKVGDREKMIL